MKAIGPPSQSRKGITEIEGKAARVAVTELGQRRSFKTEKKLRNKGREEVNSDR